MSNPKTSLCAALVAGFIGLSTPAAHASDEIQVYTNELKKLGESGLELHMNYAPRGSTEADWAGQIPSQRAFNFTPEFSWGLGNGMDWGIYVPTTRAADGTWHENGLKVRVKRMFNVEEEGALYYGANLELAWNKPSASEQRYSGEVRTIIGKDFTNWLLAANITFGFELSGPNRTRTPDLAVSLRAMRKLSDHYLLGMEHYSEVGRLNDYLPWNRSGQTSYLIAEYESDQGWALHLGLGHAWTDSMDRTVAKAIVSFDF